jgi:hypothetical protein
MFTWLFRAKDDGPTRHGPRAQNFLRHHPSAGKAVEGQKRNVGKAVPLRSSCRDLIRASVPDREDMIGIRQSPDQRSLSVVSRDDVTLLV